MWIYFVCLVLEGTLLIIKGKEQKGYKGTRRARWLSTGKCTSEWTYIITIIVVLPVLLVLVWLLLLLIVARSWDSTGVILSIESFDHFSSLISQRDGNSISKVSDNHTSEVSVLSGNNLSKTFKKVHRLRGIATVCLEDKWDDIALTDFVSVGVLLDLPFLHHLRSGEWDRALCGVENVRMRDADIENECVT